jgi:hypothetical protein
MLAMRLVFLAYRTSREEQNKWLLGEARRNDKVTLVRGFWTVLRNVGESPNNGRDEFWHPAERSLLPWRSCPEMGESPGHPPRDGRDSTAGSGTLGGRNAIPRAGPSQVLTAAALRGLFTGIHQKRTNEMP